MRAVLPYVAIHLQVPAPLFVHGDATPLTQTKLVAKVRATLTGNGMDLPCYMYMGHSFRIGAASSVTQAEIPDSMIQILSCWRSSAFQRYLIMGNSILERLGGTSPKEYQNTGHIQ